MILGLLLLAGGSLFAESHFSVYFGGAPAYYSAQDEAYRYNLHRDLHEDYRDVENDYAQVDRLRADITRDRYNLNAALQDGDEWQASRIARDLARDQRALDALLRDIAHDHHDIQRDHRELQRSYWGDWRR